VAKLARSFYPGVALLEAELRLDVYGLAIKDAAENFLLTDIAKQTLAITEKNLNASFEHARKLMQAKDINEVMQLHSES
jgi:Fe-S cluster biosynthesis and repair protein YggX